jgi:hypothetical protein
VKTGDLLIRISTGKLYEVSSHAGSVVLLADKQMEMDFVDLKSNLSTNYLAPTNLAKLICGIDLQES